MKKILLIIYMLFSLMHAPFLINNTIDTINFFITTLFSSMFALLVFTQLLLATRPQLKIIEPLTIRIFNMNSSAFLLAIFSFILGNPSGPYSIHQQYLDHHLQAKQAKRLINSISCASLPFMVMTLSLFYDQQSALVLYLIQFIANLVLLFSTRKTPIYLNDTSQEMPFFEALNKALMHTFKTMLLILGTLILINQIKCLILLYFPMLELGAEMFIEFSSGLYFISKLTQSLIPATLILSFGGFCAHMQILGVCHEINYLEYLKMRVLQITLSLILVFLKVFIT